MIQKESSKGETIFLWERCWTLQNRHKSGLYRKKASQKEYLRNSFKKMSAFFSVLCIGLFGFPALAMAAPSFEISECSGNSCTVMQNGISIPPEGNQTITIRIGIKNPDQTPIYSVQSWLQYNPQVWEVLSLSDENSDFELAAPGEFKAKSDTGEIRIGRAVSGTPITSEHSIVADITLKSKKDPTFSALSWKDFIAKDIGKTSIVGLSGVTPFNLLSSKPADIKFNAFGKSNSQPSSSPQNTPFKSSNSSATKNVGSASNNNFGVQNPNTQSNAVQNQGKTNTELQNPGLQFINIERPMGLRSRTHENGSVDHLWQMGTDSRITGYYIYYSTSSGVYMHRRDVGKTNTITFPSGFFEKGKRVYFAIQAYASGKEVSDFSDETYLVVGTVGSESHPFFEQIFPNAIKVKDENGNAYFQDPSQASQKADITDAKPKTTTNAGMDIPPEIFLIFGGIALLLSRKILQNTA